MLPTQRQISIVDPVSGSHLGHSRPGLPSMNESEHTPEEAPGWFGWGAYGAALK